MKLFELPILQLLVFDEALLDRNVSFWSPGISIFLYPPLNYKTKSKFLEKNFSFFHHTFCLEKFSRDVVLVWGAHVVI